MQREGRHGVKNPRGKNGMPGTIAINTAEINQAVKKPNQTAAQSRQSVKGRELGGTKSAAAKSTRTRFAPLASDAA